MMNTSAVQSAARVSKKKLELVPGQPDKFNAIQKVCAILRVLAQRSPLRLTEIADATSLNKATALRILATLISALERTGGKRGIGSNTCA